MSAADAIEASGDVLQFALPALVFGTTFGHRSEEDGRRWDRKGTIEFAESAALTLGVTYALKYSVNTRRPNDGIQSMPSGHTAISFSPAEFLRKRYGWEWGLPGYAAAS